MDEERCSLSSGQGSRLPCAALTARLRKNTWLVVPSFHSELLWVNHSGFDGPECWLRDMANTLRGGDSHGVVTVGGDRLVKTQRCATSVLNR